MSRTSRILWPIFAGLLIGGCVVGYLFWQLSKTTENLRAEVSRGDAVTPLAASLTNTASSLSPDQVGGGDKALTALRLGDLAALQGDWKTAESSYGVATDLGAGLIAERKLAWAEIQRRKFAEAQITIDRMKREGLRNEDALLLQVTILLHSAKFADATKMLASADDTPQKHYEMALLDIAQQKHDDAKKELTTVIAGYDPELRDEAKTIQDAYTEFDSFPSSQAEHLLTLLSRSLASVQECEIALPLLDTVISHIQDYRDAWIVQGYCQLVTERPDVALTSLEHAYGLDPGKPEIQYFLGRAHAQLGDHENAITFLQYAINNGISPIDPVRRVLAKEAELTGNPALELEQLRSLAQAENATLDDVTAYVNLSLSTGAGQQATDVAMAAVNKWPMEPNAWEMLGRIQAATANKADARTSFQKAIDLDALSPAKEELKKL